LILFDSISHLLLLVSVFALQSASGGKMDEVFVEHFAMEQEIFAPYSLYFLNVRRRLLLDLRTQPTCEDVIKESVEVVTVVIIVVVIIILSLVFLLIIVIFDVESLSGKKNRICQQKKDEKFCTKIFSVSKQNATHVFKVVFIIIVVVVILLGGGGGGGCSGGCGGWRIGDDFSRGGGVALAAHHLVRGAVDDGGGVGGDGGQHHQGQSDRRPLGHFLQQQAIHTLSTQRQTGAC